MKISLSICFFIWIVGGLAVFTFVTSITWRSVCSDPEQGNYPTQSSSENDQGGGPLRHLIDDSTWRAITEADQKNAANHPAQTSNTKPNPRLITVICDAKISDLALAYFTYCLVIVGWFGIRSSAENTKAIERAYLFLGNGPMHFRNRRINFQLAVTNTGRCPGIMKEIKYAFLQREALPVTPNEVDWAWEIMEYDWVTPTGTRRDKLRRVQGPIGDCFFVACLTYQDVFTKHRHTSRMSMKIRPDAGENEQVVRAGGDPWNAWE
jgi:hypothetical protein